MSHKHCLYVSFLQRCADSITWSEARRVIKCLKGDNQEDPIIMKLHIDRFCYCIYVKTISLEGEKCTRTETDKCGVKEKSLKSENFLYSFFKNICNILFSAKMDWSVNKVTNCTKSIIMKTCSFFFFFFCLKSMYILAAGQYWASL